MKELDIDTNLSIEEIKKIDNYSRKKTIRLLNIISIISYIATMIFLNYIATVSIVGLAFCGITWICATTRINSVYLANKEAKLEAIRQQRNENINSIKNGLEKENVLIDDESLENAAIISTHEKINYVEEHKKVNKTVSDIYLLDVNDQIKILKEIKSIIKSYDGIEVDLDYSLLTDEEVSEKQKELTITKKLIIK